MPRLGVNLLGSTLADLLPHPAAPASLALPRLPVPGQAVPFHPLAVSGTSVLGSRLATAARLGARAATLVATALLLTWPAGSCRVPGWWGQVACPTGIWCDGRSAKPPGLREEAPPS